MQGTQVSLPEPTEQNGEGGGLGGTKENIWQALLHVARSPSVRVLSPDQGWGALPVFPGPDRPPPGHVSVYCSLAPCVKGTSPRSTPRCFAPAPLFKLTFPRTSDSTLN